ncbi:NUDIX domain-containing protein [Parafrankia sp. BMG5.11]|uniref:NUDIX hydrolase n=1 Tax=Parafrankia sp. BMG5.11 TaxID=222540 RepID=UPI00103F1160|nr:NUDIX domain-containing protein [Parafrankia sp. BMG5.11]TCJ34646.1 NUDIX domain-containing protein [Parafrankia sp. BMG5.11]
MKERYGSIVDVHLILRREGRILLAKRINTGFGDGFFNLPSGHLEQGESVIEGVIREAREEIGVVVDPAALTFLHVMHHRGASGDARIGFFFEAERWEGEPANLEPEKCGGLVWADPDALPENTVTYPAAGIAQCQGGAPFSVDGWDR